jgi:hypothetical protein
MRLTPSEVERAKRHSKISNKKKLAWLEEMARFCAKANSRLTRSRNRTSHNLHGVK